MNEPLLTWYDHHRRILPWREDPAPYHVWISEIMLQQTRVEAVKEYYRRFLEVLPDTAALAAAPEDVYLKLWEGLGYYNRVRNLHKAAVLIMDRFGGKIPSDAQTLRNLPGIGAYTSAAIASIAFGEIIPAIDGNLLRIFSRMTACEQNIKSGAAQKEAYRWYSDWMHASDDITLRPGDFNQALMDLGSGICSGNCAPKCGFCPLRGRCMTASGIEAGLFDADDLPYPVMPEKKERRVEKKTVFLIHHHSMTAIIKRPDTGLLAGMYEFPSMDGFVSLKASAEFVRSLGFEPVRILPLEEVKHIFTHKEWHMRGFNVVTAETADSSSNVSDTILLRTTRSILADYPVPSAYRAYLEHLEDL